MNLASRRGDAVAHVRRESNRERERSFIDNQKVTRSMSRGQAPLASDQLASVLHLPSCEKATLVSNIATMVAVDIDNLMGTQQQEVLFCTPTYPKPSSLNTKDWTLDPRP